MAGRAGRETAPSQRGLGFKIAFISVLKGVESFFKTSSAAAIDVPKAGNSRQCAPAPGTAPTAGMAQEWEQHQNRLGNSWEWEQHQEQAGEEGLSTSELLVSPQPDVQPQLGPGTAPPGLQVSVSVLECSTEGQSSCKCISSLPIHSVPASGN